MQAPATIETALAPEEREGFRLACRLMARFGAQIEMEGRRLRLSQHNPPPGIGPMEYAGRTVQNLATAIEQSQAALNAPFPAGADPAERAPAP